jgi:squalene-hopene/tetraprenyl-beta-curcumene cyclase
MSPVWDTAWSLLALRWAGVPREHPAVRAAVEWLLNEQVEAIGDWQVKVPMKQCGGWSFEFDNDYYPDVDDTAAVVISLLASAEPQRIRGPVEKAVKWAIAMQSSNGGWGAFDKDNIRQIVYKLPFADFGALLDEPSEDVSAHVIEMLGAVGRSNADPAIARGLDYLAGTQKPWGSWYGRWGVNHIYGTWCVVSSLASLGALPERVQRATDWLLTVQDPDRGWGETCQSYEDERLAGVGNSTPSQTAWAVLSLQQAGRGEEPAALDGLRHLCERQMSGTWEQPEFTGTGFPGDFYIDYHMYRHVFPLMALAGPPRHDELKVRQ